MKHILFDLDGTLVDSSQGIMESFRHTFTELKISLPSDQQLSTFIGPPLETTFAKFFQSADKLEQALNIYRAYYQKKGVHQAKLYDGVKQLLKDLKLSDYQLYVTTSKNQTMANLMLTELGINSYFNAIYGALPNRFHKADVIEACLTDCNLSKNETVIIGDTVYDIIGGQKVGIYTIAVTWGFGLQTDLQKCQPNFICHYPQDIQKTLQNV